MEINLKIESKNINDDFARIADDLMNHWILQSEESLYRVAEIEFYFQSDSHNDKYAHAHKLQKDTGRWYFHGSGVDLTFGSKDMIGGILIRAICNLDKSKKEEYTYGPLNTITELFSNLQTIYSSNISFGLVEDSEKIIPYEKPISVPRVGLNPKNAPKMYAKPYRYLVMPKQKHAEKYRIEEAMKKQGCPNEAIKNIWG